MMNLSFTTLLPIAALWLIAAATPAQAQTTPRTKSMAGTVLTADANMKVVRDYADATMAEDWNKMQSLLAPDFKQHGPSIRDSATSEALIKRTQQEHKMMTNRKLEYVVGAINAPAGTLRGQWVTAWGVYSYTIAGKTVKMPMQQTFRVTNGKIDRIQVYYDEIDSVLAAGYQITPPAASR